MNKYWVGGEQTEYQPGSDELVLANLLDIVDPDEINDVELLLLSKLYDEVLTSRLPMGAILSSTLMAWHRRWLGKVYKWAGELRTVNMSKGGFNFAAAPRIPKLLSELDANQMSRLTPCFGMSRAELIAAIAEVHVELILIHPFREGNGRLARLLADVMAVQAGYEPLDYSGWEQQKQNYIAAIHAGLACDYRPMQTFVDLALV